MKRSFRNYRNQAGVTLIILAVILVLAGTAIFFTVLNANNIKNARDIKTANALLEAKNALLGYSVTVSLKVYPSDPCPNTCPRPGDLPCPDTNNDGTAESGCGNATGSTGQADRLGRLPWKTLGLQDLRDGNGNRLWYAVSNNFKNNTKTLPLNNDTLGTINVTDFGGVVSANATATSGAVAVIISPGEALIRQDGIQQTRSIANENIAIHYLDNALGEDNADFIDSTNNGFVKGNIRNVNGDIILNDQLIVISQKDMFSAIDAKVLKEVKAAFTKYFDDNSYYPSPASFANVTCLGTSIGVTCNPSLANYEGRIPATMLLVPPLTSPWDADSILRAESDSNWFQQNGWREQVYYAVSPSCGIPFICSEELTLYGAINNLVDKRIILLMAGPPLTGQVRANNSQKILLTNYYELENNSTLNSVYQRSFPLSPTFNDSVESIP